ncbi:MAG: Arylsulfatase [Acidobacteria bacterium]|nr:Arylsulfatase [Acidobacteriota bacterium]
MRTALTRRLLIVATLLAITIAGCRRGGGNSTETFAGAPVIFITIDTLRADHLPAYGYKNVETPAIDAFRRDAILYKNAYSHVPMTLPSHVSILTGLLPQEHEVRNNLGFPYDPHKHPPISMMLKSSGYATGAAISAYVLRGATGLSGGFDFYDDSMNTRNNVSVGELSRVGSATAKVAEQWIGERGTSPFFFLFHIFEPHTPYAPIEPFRSRYANPYDGEIATSDAIVGQFIEYLKSAGIYDRALIVLMSDHGEGLGDHGELEHGIFLYREEIHVPLLVKLPKSQRAGESVDRHVQLIDVVPTALKVVGAEVPETLKGMSLLETPNDAAPRRIYSETLFPRIHFGWSELRSLVDARHQYIEAPKPELYDFIADPREQKNVLNDERRVYTQLRDAMAPLRTAATAPTNVDPEEAAKLAALGYIGTVHSDAATGPLRDPKDMIGVLEEMKVAAQHERAHDYRDAIAIYEKLLQENPRFTDVLLRLAILHEELGDLRGAVAYDRKAIETSPELAPGLALTIGNLQLRLGELNDAAGHAQLAMPRAPGAAHLLLARIALAKRDLATAEREAQLAMQDKVRSRDAAVFLAQAWTSAGRVPEALQLLDRVRAETVDAGLGPVEDLEATRADLLARLGRNAEAEEGFRQELTIFPKNRDAYTKLAVLFVSENRLDDARRTLDEMVRANPGKQSMLMAAGTFDAVDLPQDASRWRRAAQSAAR